MTRHAPRALDREVDGADLIEASILRVGGSSCAVRFAPAADRPALERELPLFALVPAEPKAPLCGSQRMRCVRE